MAGKVEKLPLGEAQAAPVTAEELADEDALAAALREGRLAGAGLDVFQQEPLQHNPFQGLDNVVLSPHLAAYSREGLREAGVLAAQGVVAVLGGQCPDPAVVVNPEVFS
jgi:D-3-phosphoglycerate dehydrogenase / 2-oxoglutarate reductase